MKVRSHILRPFAARGIAMICAAVVIANAHSAQAGVNVWTSHGPEGGQVFAIDLDPAAPGTLYAGISYGGADGNNRGMFKSTDGAGTWSAANTGLEPGSITMLAIDPVTPGTLYGGTGDGLFKSTDAGATWNATGLTTTIIDAFAIDPTTPAILYAATRGVFLKLFKSTDAGATWDAVSTPLGGTDSVHALVVDPSMPSRLYAGTNDNGVFDLEQVAACIGDCHDSGSVTVNDVITLVNIALGNAAPAACAQGVAPGATVDVTMIIQAVNNALSGSPAPMGPAKALFRSIPEVRPRPSAGLSPASSVP